MIVSLLHESDEGDTTMVEGQSLGCDGAEAIALRAVAGD
jgi:hypothetical protein